MHRRPMSEPEKKFQEIIDANKYPFYFNGNAQNENPLIIDGKIPDFVHNIENKLIEIWGNFYHKGQNPQDRINFFKERGWGCIVFWASELRKSDSILDRIEAFLK